MSGSCKHIALWFSALLLAALAATAQYIGDRHIYNYEGVDRPGLIDSLTACLDTATGTHRIDILNTLIPCVSKVDMQKAVAMTDEALTEAESLDYRYGLAYLHLYKAKQYAGILQDPQKRLEHYAIASELIDPYDDYGKYIIRAEYSNVLIGQGYTGEGLKMADKVLNTLGKYIDEPRRATLLYIKSLALDQLGMYDEEMEALKLALDHLKSVIPVEGQWAKSTFAVISMIGHIYSITGHYREASLFYHEHIRSIDSLFSPAATTQRYRAKLTGSLARTHCHWGNYDSAMLYHRLSVTEFSEDSVMSREANRIDISNQLEGMGIVFQEKAVYDSALYYFNRSMRIRKEIGDVLGIAMCHDGIGDVYRMWGKFSHSLLHLDSALSLKKDYLKNLRESFARSESHPRINGTRESISITLLFLGRLYLDWNKPEDALQYLEESLEISREIRYYKGTAEAFLEMGNAMNQRHENKRAMTMFDSACALYQRSGVRPGEATALHKKGVLLSKQGFYPASRDLLEQSLAIFREIEQKQKEAELLKDLGVLLIKTNKPEGAAAVLEESYRYSTELKLKHLGMEVAGRLADLYFKNGQGKKAYSLMKEYSRIKDSLYTLESHRLLTEASARFDLVQQENRLALLASEKELREYRLGRNKSYLWGLSALLLFSALLAFLLIRQGRLRSQQKNLVLEQQLLRTQMNPHFIFNALANIQSFMFSNQTEKAGRYLTRLSRLIRNILESSKDEMVQMDKELGTIESYLELQQLRHDGKFDFDIVVDPAIEPATSRIPPMLAQPFIENSVEHGIRHKLAKGFIRVEFSKQADGISCKVEDNGVGRKKAQELTKEKRSDHRSMATSITKERLESLGRKYRKSFTLTITDLQDEWGEPAGTRVEFTFPFVK